MPLIKKLIANKIVIGIVAAAIVGIGSYKFFSKKPAHQLISVLRGDIAEQVIVTGSTKPVRNIDLAFERTGKIVRVNFGVGATVKTGAVLAELGHGELSGQLKEAEANVAAARAKLDALKRGARQEDIQITRTQLNKAEQDLANDYDGVLSILSDAYSKSDDAVRNQVSALFSNADTTTPQLTFGVNDSQMQIDLQAQRATAGIELNAWKNEIAALNAAAPSNSAKTLEQGLKNGQSHLAVVLAFLNKTMDAIVAAPSLSSATVTAYKTSVTTARGEVNTAINNVNAGSQEIASQKFVVNQNKDQLASQTAGSTAEDIRAQEASVAQMEAGVTVAEAQLNQTVMISPINGTVTRQDAKVGEIAAANKSLVSVISADNLEIEVNIPEVDIVKIILQDKVDITFDAFQGEKFSGRVVKIDPAETVVDGVVNFKVTVAFDKPDGRIKSGLTANLGIETVKKSGVLILPQVAIVQNDRGAFVRKYERGSTKDYPVKIGIRGQDGNVEILSGVSEGDSVVNVGIKAQ
ncbi:MAG: efflux RND transporter periplasmic adaptor subunit [Candidatus Liptonbacteria bacterium]|nr:efflux RND transporter periplasmic adaptor subunit [Candidatus Liptonbacteria bacterium]